MAAVVKQFPSLCWICKHAGSGKESEAWHHEKTGDGIGEDAASMAVEAPGLKGSWTEAEA